MQKIEYMEDFYHRPINIGELRALGDQGWIFVSKAEGEYTYLFYRVVQETQIDVPDELQESAAPRKKYEFQPKNKCRHPECYNIRTIGENYCGRPDCMKPQF